MRVFAPQAADTDALAGKHQVGGRRSLPVPVAPISLMQSDNALVQRKSNCACGGGCPSCRQDALPEAIQTKLQVSTPGDRYEQEADQVAAQVMRMPEAEGSARADVGTRFPNLQPLQPRALHQAEESLRPKEIGGQDPRMAAQAQSQIDASRGGGGEPLSIGARAFFEPRFGHSFNDVRVHADAGAAESARSVKAQAYTIGRNIVFGEGQYEPGTIQGRLLLAHELTHVLQQRSAGASLQRQHVPDTGFRYTPPATVTRSIIEIQGIVGTTPDGDYGENTRLAVERYQAKLKALGLYTDTIDGKWGNNTELAHVAFATSPSLLRRGYNCAGFAFKDYIFHDLAPTKAIYATMTKLADCAQPCSPFFHKFWFWQFDLKTVHTPTGRSSPAVADFHTVGGQTDSKGNGPDQVMSKNGQRPVEGPKPPLDWELKSGPAPDTVTGLPVPDFEWVITGTTLECFCSEKLP